MQRMDGLTEIADELIHGEFVLIWYTPEGRPYCPTRLIAMVTYLRGLTPCVIDTGEKVQALCDVLNHRAMTAERRAMIETAMEEVFHVAVGLSAECRRGVSLCHLKSSVSSLDVSVAALEHALKKGY